MELPFRYTVDTIEETTVSGNEANTYLLLLDPLNRKFTTGFPPSIPKGKATPIGITDSKDRREYYHDSRKQKKP